MPMFYFHLLVGGAFLSVWGFIAAMLFRDRLLEIRHRRAEESHEGLASPHYMRRREKARSARVA
jgi:hypothetical protein